MSIKMILMNEKKNVIWENFLNHIFINNIYNKIN